MAGDEGHSLAEVLVASLLSLLVASAVFELLNPEGATVGARAEMVDMQQRARVAQDVLGRDLRQAGSGPDAGVGAGPLLGAFAPILPRRIGRSGADAFDAARADAISLLTVPAGSLHSRLQEPFLGGPSLVVEPGAGCGGALLPCGRAGTPTVLVHDGAGRFDLFALTAGPGSYAVEPLRGDTPSAYPAGAAVAVADVHVYYHDAARRQLRHYDGRLTDVPVVDDVVGVGFEYFGDAAPPARPMPPDGTGNCLYDAGGTPAAGLVTLPGGGISLVPLPLALFRDGPWCGSGSLRYDADLLRIRQVRVRVRVQASAPTLRAAGPAYAAAGTVREARRAVPDYGLEFDVTPRNLNLSR